MRVMDIVTINDINDTPAIVEGIRTHEDGMTIYSVRSPYTGILYAREVHEITPATDAKRDEVLGDVRIFQHFDEIMSVNPELKIVKDYGDAVMTQGVVTFEIEATERAIRNYKLTPKMIGALETGQPSSGSARVLGREQTIAALQRRGLVHADRRWTDRGRRVAEQIFWYEGAPSLDDLHEQALTENVECGKDLDIWPYGACTERTGHAGRCDRRARRPVQNGGRNRCTADQSDREPGRSERRR